VAGGLPKLTVVRFGNINNRKTYKSKGELGTARIVENRGLKPDSQTRRGVTLGTPRPTGAAGGRIEGQASCLRIWLEYYVISEAA